MRCASNKDIFSKYCVVSISQTTETENTIIVVRYALNECMLFEYFLTIISFPMSYKDKINKIYSIIFK